MTEVSARPDSGPTSGPTSGPISGPIARSIRAAELTAARWWRHPTVAALGVLAVYLLLAATLDPRGRIGGDTGGKVAVLAVIDAGEHPHFDVGYWAAAEDPDGVLHPLYYTAPLEGRYQQLTSLPMVWLARPLYAIGGIELARLLPMAGGILTAFAARALVARGGRGSDGRSSRDSARPWHAFWLVAVGSPVAIYSLDLWEHTLGLAGIAWGIVALADGLAARRSGVVSGLLAGLAFGAAATMRTEALVYGAVATSVAMVLLAIRRRGRAAIAVGGSAFGGLVTALALNDLFERAVLGAPLRAGRAAGVASESGANLGARVEDAWVTLAGLNYGDVALDRALGALIVFGLAAVVWFARRGDSPRLRIAAVVTVAAFATRLGSGLSFIPGVVPVWPVAIGGAVMVWRPRHRAGASSTPWWPAFLGAIGLLAAPVIWITQYAGMPGAQWGGRYLFASALVLGAVAVAGASTVPRAVRAGAVVLSIAVTASGVLYLRDRTHVAAATFDELVRLDADVVVSTVPFLFREAGAVYTPERRWLTAADAESLSRAAAIAGGRGGARLAVVTEAGGAAPELAGYRATGAERLPWVGRDLAVRYYVAEP